MQRFLARKKTVRSAGERSSDPSRNRRGEEFDVAILEPIENERKRIGGLRRLRHSRDLRRTEGLLRPDDSQYIV
jgi:hypothetical protein